MNNIVLPVLITIIFFSIRGIISLFIIIWGGKKVKKYFDKKKQQESTETPFS